MDTRKLDNSTPAVAPQAIPLDINLPDITIKCTDCGNDFIFSGAPNGGEQRYYKDRNLATPKRCVKCRVIRRQRTIGNVRVTEEKD